MTASRFHCSTLVVAIVTILAGCATQAPPQTSPSPTIQVRQTLNTDMRTCTQQYGYDPAKTTGVGENTLAPNELEWRQCMYRAVGSYAKANSTIAPMYESLINSDVAMTAAVKQGTMTRSQRRARIEQLVAEIQTAQDKINAAATAKQQRQAQEFNNTISAIRALGQ